VGPRAGLDTEATGKVSCLYRGPNLYRPVVQSVVSSEILSSHGGEYEAQNLLGCTAVFLIECVCNLF
jgi:hypothetical protein